MVLDDPKLVRLVAGITGGIEAPAQFILQVTIVIHLQTNQMIKYCGFLRKVLSILDRYSVINKMILHHRFGLS